MVVVRAERENSWALAFQLYFPIALYRQRIDLSSAFFDNDSISHLELLGTIPARRFDPLYMLESDSGGLKNIRGGLSGIYREGGMKI